MQSPDRPSIRRANLLSLFSEFVSARMAQSPSQQINGLDREFAALIQVHNTYFSGMKSGARTIGDKLARQIEVLCSMEKGWLDEVHGVPAAAVFKAEPLAGLTEFLDLAAQTYTAAPESRDKLVRLLRDVLKRHESNKKSSASVDD